ncbi:unnamed protein product, partial [Ilex paraguariensis]
VKKPSPIKAHQENQPTKAKVQHDEKLLRQKPPEQRSTEADTPLKYQIAKVKTHWNNDLPKVERYSKESRSSNNQANQVSTNKP